MEISNAERAAFAILRAQAGTRADFQWVADRMRPFVTTSYRPLGVAEQNAQIRRITDHALRALARRGLVRSYRPRSGKRNYGRIITEYWVAAPDEGLQTEAGEDYSATARGL